MHQNGCHCSKYRLFRIDRGLPSFFSTKYLQVSRPRSKSWNCQAFVLRLLSKSTPNRSYFRNATADGRSLAIVIINYHLFRAKFIRLCSFNFCFSFISQSWPACSVKNMTCLRCNTLHTFPAYIRCIVHVLNPSASIPEKDVASLPP